MVRATLDRGSSPNSPQAGPPVSLLVHIAARFFPRNPARGRTRSGPDACPGTSFDDGFRAARRRPRNFVAPHPTEPSGSFRGELRGYQKDSLGWMRFLSRLGFGGCPADDMGLGMTIQILARLVRGREDGLLRQPTLIVVPRSRGFKLKRRRPGSSRI